MKKITKPKLFSIVGCLILIVLISFIIKSRQDEKTIVYGNIPPWVKENSGSVTYSLHEPNGKIIDNGSTIEQPSNGKLHRILSLGNFRSISGDYGLMILKDFEQAMFEVDGKEYSLYPFTVGSNETINIDTKVDIAGGDVQEIDYIVIKKPNYVLQEKDVKKAVSLQKVIGLRYKIKQDANKKNIYNYETPIKRLKTKVTADVFTIRSMDELKIIFDAKPNENVFLSVGNDKEEDLDFAIVAFIDWKQVPLLNGEIVNYFKVQKGERQVFPIKFPPPKGGEGNFQIIAFPKPYKISKFDANASILASPRTVVQ